MSGPAVTEQMSTMLYVSLSFTFLCFTFLLPVSVSSVSECDLHIMIEGSILELRKRLFSKCTWIVIVSANLFTGGKILKAPLVFCQKQFNLREETVHGFDYLS